MTVLHALGHALAESASMAWQILWALVLGFALSAAVQAVVRKSEVARLLPDDSPRSLAVAAALGTASSSCSYAAVALARALVRKGANFTAAIAFEIASTNLVVELGILLALILGWQFTLAEFTGGPLMIVFVALLFRRVLSAGVVRGARAQADRAVAGSMEGHAAMDMSVQTSGSVLRRLVSPAGFTSTSEYFVMDWAAVYRDIVGGLLIAGALAAWVPAGFWGHFFFSGHPLAARVWGPLVGPIVAVASFVCSIGNVPLAAVLWHAGISFGGVTSFLFADLVIMPIVAIYRKYYGPAAAWRIVAVLYAAAVAAGYAVDAVFGALGLVPSTRTARILQVGVRWNYTSVLDLVFALLAAVLVYRFVRSGGLPMLRMMGGAPEPGDAQAAEPDRAG